MICLKHVQLSICGVMLVIKKSTNRNSRSLHTYMILIGCISGSDG